MVTAARSGSRDALGRLVTRHQAWIYNIARRMTYNAPDAEDATVHGQPPTTRQQR